MALAQDSPLVPASAAPQALSQTRRIGQTQGRGREEERERRRERRGGAPPAMGGGLLALVLDLFLLGTFNYLFLEPAVPRF